MTVLQEFIDEHRNAAITQILDKEIKGELPPSKKLLYKELSKIQPKYKYNLEIYPTELPLKEISQWKRTK